MSDFALQDRGHYATRTVGTYCIYDGLPLTYDSLSKQFQHAALEANKPHTVSSAFPRTGQDQNAPSSGETPPLRRLSKVDDSLSVHHRQRRFHRLKVQTAEQHYH